MKTDKISLVVSEKARRQLEFIKESLDFEDDGEVIFAGLYTMYKLAKSNKNNGIKVNKIKRRKE